MSERSPAEELVVRLAARLGKRRAHELVDVVLDELGVVEAAALEYDWRDFWARPKQLPPLSEWRSWGFLCGRGFGKSRSVAEFVLEEARAGRAMRIGLAAQNEPKSLEIQIFGDSGLLTNAPPWFRPEWVASDNQLVWPNGAVATVLTPEAPENFRGGQYHLFWATEFQSWPAATRLEAYTNMLFATRLGYSRLVWDATPKKGHPILLNRLKLGAHDPERHVIVRGSTRENAANLGIGVIEDFEAEFGGTAKGREELEGEMSEDAEGALFKTTWFKRRARGPMSYRVVACDPAVTNRKGSDTTGIVTAGLLEDGAALVLHDDSGRMHVAKWGEIVLDRYETEECDLVIAETNKGGDLVVQSLRVLAKERDLTVVVVDKDDRPRRVRGTVFVKEVHARGAKADRAEPVATAYEKGERVYHCTGEDFVSLETTLTTWEPSPHKDSPGDLDALVHGLAELLGLREPAVDGREAFRGLVEAGQRLAGATTTSSSNLAAALRGLRRPDRI